MMHGNIEFYLYVLVFFDYDKGECLLENCKVSCWNQDLDLDSGLEKKNINVTYSQHLVGL